MKSQCCLSILTILILSACETGSIIPTNTKIAEISATTARIETFTPIPPPTITLTSTPTETPLPASPTLSEQSEITETPTPIVENTKPPTGEFPGAQISGTVTMPDGLGIAGVNIYYVFSVDPGGTLLDVTDESGYFSGFISIPHEEVIRVRAEFENYKFKPGQANRSWINGEFAWHHYGGYENVTLGYIGSP